MTLPTVLTSITALIALQVQAPIHQLTANEIAENIMNAAGVFNAFHVLVSAYLLVFFAFWVLLIAKSTAVIKSERQDKDKIPVQTGYFFTGHTVLLSSLWSTLLFGLSLSIIMGAYVLCVLVMRLSSNLYELKIITLFEHNENVSQIFTDMLKIDFFGLLLLIVPGYIRYMFENELDYIPVQYEQNLDKLKDLYSQIGAKAISLTELDKAKEEGTLKLDYEDLRKSTVKSMQETDQSIRVYRLYNLYYDRYMYKINNSYKLMQFFYKFGSVYRLSLFKKTCKDGIKAGWLLNEDLDTDLYRNLPI